jgi:hypothetical protein
MNALVEFFSENAVVKIAAILAIILLLYREIRKPKSKSDKEDENQGKD